MDYHESARKVGGELTEDQTSDIIFKYPHLFIYVEDPSEQLQLIAVKADYNNIRHIENPSEEVQLAAVNKNPKAIKYIKNPCEKVKALINFI